MPRIKVERDPERAREELTKQLGERLEETAGILPDSDVNNGSSAGHRARSARRGSGGGQRDTGASLGSKKSSSQANITGLSSDVWETRRDVLSNTLKALKNKSTPIEDVPLPEARQIIAIADGSFPVACQIIEEQVMDILRPRYFAVEKVDLTRGVWRRIHSSNPSKLPLTEDRPLPAGTWAEKLLGERKPVCASNIDNVEQQLPDNSLFRSLKCFSYCFIPISCAPESPHLEVLTVLGKRDFFKPESLEGIKLVYSLAFCYLGIAHTGLYLRNPDNVVSGVELVPVEDGKSGPQGGVVSLIREKAPTLIRSSMDRAKYLQQRTEYEASHRMLQKNPKGVSKSTLGKLKRMLAIVRGDMEEASLMLEETAKKKVKSRYFAVEEVDLENGLYRRIRSNRPKDLPVTEMRPIPDGVWARGVILNRGLLVSNAMRESPGHFPDYDLVSSLGCQSCAYLPVCDSDKHELLGILTFFDVEGFFSDKIVRKIIKMRGEAVTCLGSARIAHNLGVADVKGCA